MQQLEPVQGPLMVPAEAAAFLRVTLPQLYHLTSEKRIPFLKVGGQLRFVREQLIEVLAAPVEPGVKRRGSRNGGGRPARTKKVRRGSERFVFKTTPRTK